MEAVADRELFAQLMAESERPVYAFLASKVRDRTTMSDIAQEAFFWHTGDLTRMTEAALFSRGS